METIFEKVQTTHHMSWQPSDSWKLRAISVPVVGSVHTIKVSVHASQHPCCIGYVVVARTLLLLETIFLAYPGLQEDAISVVFRVHEDFGVVLPGGFILYTRRVSYDVHFTRHPSADRGSPVL